MARQKKNGPNTAAQRMVEAHLRYREQLSPAGGAGEHLDEDRLAAFVEGCLTEAESAPLVAHMVGCSPCRRATAQLVRLEDEIGDAATAAATDAPEPGRIRRLLDSLAARVLPQSDEDAVFAYHAPAEDFEQHERAKADKTADEGEAEDENSAPRA
ncbi:MAG TPA: zf-HC2 domain-containing protein [Pyrinomonadaceae bacterium]|nr:zf-HC2 domain-containing protein [Pyrinomonadaceae bacterium]